MLLKKETPIIYLYVGHLLTILNSQIKLKRGVENCLNVYTAIFVYFVGCLSHYAATTGKESNTINLPVSDINTGFFASKTGDLQLIANEPN